MAKNRKLPKNHLRHVLTVNDEQLQVIMSALDSYARINTGQFHFLVDHWLGRLPIEDFANLRSTLECASAVVSPAKNAHHNYGIGSKEIPESARVAYDLMKVCRHHYSHLHYPLEPGEMPLVSHDKPFRLSNSDLAEIKTTISEDYKEECSDKF